MFNGTTTGASPLPRHLRPEATQQKSSAVVLLVATEGNVSDTLISSQSINYRRNFVKISTVARYAFGTIFAILTLALATSLTPIPSAQAGSRTIFEKCSRVKVTFDKGRKFDFACTEGSIDGRPYIPVNVSCSQFPDVSANVTCELFMQGGNGQPESKAAKQPAKKTRGGNPPNNTVNTEQQSGTGNPRQQGGSNQSDTGNPAQQGVPSNSPNPSNREQQVPSESGNPGGSTTPPLPSPVNPSDSSPASPGTIHLIYSKCGQGFSDRAQGMYKFSCGKAQTVVGEADNGETVATDLNQGEISSLEGFSDPVALLTGEEDPLASIFDENNIVADNNLLNIDDEQW